MMRRRDRLYIYIIGVILLSACSKSEADRPDNTISFAPVAAKPTKTIISGTTYPTSESFVVSAFHNGTAAYFEDLTATYSNSNSLWATTEAQYWPLGGSLDFIAYSPASAGLTIDATDGVTATDYTVQNTAQMTTDLCYASATVADCSNHPAAVPLTFSHALSQIVFRVKAAAYYTTNTTTVTLSMTSLSLSGIYSVGDFAAGAWSNQSTAYTYTLSNSATELTYDNSHNPVASDVCSFLFLPQEISDDARLNVGYNVVQNYSGNTYTLTNAPVSIDLKRSITQWEPGKKYIYTLSISMDNVITFTASAVGWQDENANIIVEEN